MATKKENFEAILEVLGEDYPALSAFVENEITLVNRKHKVKPEVAEARAELQDSVLEVLATVGEPMTTAEVKTAFEGAEDLSSQKLSAALKALVAEGNVVAVGKVKGNISYQAQSID